MPKFKNLIRLMAMTYDRGGKIVGMIENRLGEDGFFDFMRTVYTKYQYRILRVADFQREWRGTPAARGRRSSTNGSTARE